MDNLRARIGAIVALNRSVLQRVLGARTLNRSFSLVEQSIEERERAEEIITQYPDDLDDDTQNPMIPE